MDHALPAALLALGKISHPSCDVTFAERAHLHSPLHTHESTNHVLVIQGCLFLTLDGQERALMPGTWCTIPAHAMHAERFEAPTQVIVFWQKSAESSPAIQTCPAPEPSAPSALQADKSSS